MNNYRIKLQDNIVLLFCLTFTFIPLNVAAEEYTCSYPNYTDGKPVIIHISVEGKTAIVENFRKTEYLVLESNEYGIVLVDPVASVGVNSPEQNDIGLFAILIDKKTMNMTHGSISITENEDSSRSGVCKNV